MEHNNTTLSQTTYIIYVYFCIFMLYWSNYWFQGIPKYIVCVFFYCFNVSQRIFFKHKKTAAYLYFGVLSLFYAICNNNACITSTLLPFYVSLLQIQILLFFRRLEELGYIFFYVAICCWTSIVVCNDKSILFQV